MTLWHRQMQVTMFCTTPECRSQPTDSTRDSSKVPSTSDTRFARRGSACRGVRAKGTHHQHNQPGPLRCDSFTFQNLLHSLFVRRCASACTNFFSFFYSTHTRPSIHPPSPTGYSIILPPSTIKSEEEFHISGVYPCHT